MSDYLLLRDKELERLVLQARVWEPEAEALLARIGLPAGAHAIDVGCGAYGVLGALARAVGPGGRVVGLDADDKLLAAARAHVDGAGLTQVELVHGDAFATGFPDGSFDVAHVRFMVAPLGRGAALVAELARLVKPGGVVILEEPDVSSWRVWPDRPRVVQLIAAFTTAFIRAGGDADAGRKGCALLTAAGLTNIDARAAVLAMRGGHPYLRLPVQFAASLRPRLVDGIMSAAELDAAVAECEEQARDEATFGTSFVLVQTWGRKPAACNE
jgi:SAM-dependent methyltransferase